MKTAPMFSQLLAYCLMALLCGPSLVEAQSPSTPYLLDRLEQKILESVEKDHKIMRVEVGILQTDSTAHVLRMLHPNTTYEIQAFAQPAEFGDINVRLYRLRQEEDKLLEMQDIANSPEGRLKFQPTTEGLYEIEVFGRDYPRDRGYGMFALIITAIN